jgi:hypothetical protein
MSECETRVCPHCGSTLGEWIAPPETGWGMIVVCNNNDCPFFVKSGCSIEHKDPDNPFGCRYAENPENGYKPFNILAWLGPNA